jgi:metallo-beta-lactamase family protein
MAISVTGIMKRHPECFDRETLKLFEDDEDPFSFPGLDFTRTPEDSRHINFINSHAVIIAGSGMCTGGRIKHHLKHNIWREESSIIFVGFQAEGTLGRKIVDRQRTVKIFGESYRVRAHVHTIGGFSSHADKSILTDWLQKSVGTDRVFLVHGEDKGARAFKKELERLKIAKAVHIPHLGETVSL